MTAPALPDISRHNRQTSVLPALVKHSRANELLGKLRDPQALPDGILEPRYKRRSTVPELTHSAPQLSGVRLSGGQVTFAPEEPGANVLRRSVSRALSQKPSRPEPSRRAALSADAVLSSTAGSEQQFGEDDKDDDANTARGVRMSLPMLAAATKLSALPSIKRSKSLKGFLLKDTGGADDKSDLDLDEFFDSKSTASATSKVGPGGGPLGNYDKKLYQPREDDVLRIANRMGMVKVGQSLNDTLKAATKRNAKANLKASSLTVNQVSQLGVQLNVLLRLGEDMEPDLTTHEVVWKYIRPQTAQLKCRYIDLVADRLTDSPTYYVIHAWESNFCDMVETVRQYFALMHVNVDDVFIWIDILCINQHRELAPSDLTVVKDLIGTMDKVLLVVDRKGLCLQRSWVYWELWHTSQHERTDRLVVLPVSWAWCELYHAFLTMDAANSTSHRDRERLMLVGEMQKSVDLAQLTTQVKEMMLNGARREMGRSEKLMNVNPRRFISAASTVAMVLFLMSRYTEAEDMMRSVTSHIEKSGSKEVPEFEEAAAAYHVALILRDKGMLADAERVLQEFAGMYRGMQDELYLEGVSTYVEVLCVRKLYTKAEMAGRKMIEEREKMFGRRHVGMIKSYLLLASIGASQRLYEEAEEHVSAALRLAKELFGADSKDAATCYHLLASCSYYSNRNSEAKPMLERALAIRMKLLGNDHPATLESKALQASMLVSEHRVGEAEVLMTNIFRSRLRSYGAEHHDTLETLGILADLLRKMRKEEDAEGAEKKLIETGRAMLRYHKIDRFKSLQYISNFLSSREHLLEKAALFLAKAFVVFKEKLGSEAELTSTTKHQLAEIIEKEKGMAMTALEQAQLYNDPGLFQDAEVLFKQSWSVSKLLYPDGDHKPVAQGLADALFGQGKVQEAKTVMRSAGLVRKGVRQNMPASYLRWLNTRVAKYLDSKGDMEEA